MPFVRNLWYVAAFSEDVSRSLLSRRICDEPILLYRREDGSIAAIGNRCPHRFAPLDLGKLVGDTVQCAYHGLAFGPDGAMAANPHGPIMSACRVPHYPVRDRHGMVWLWMGDEDKLDEKLIPDFSFLIDSRFTTVKGMIGMAANYELITDNLLDLTHVEFLHEGLLGSEAIKIGKHKVTQEGLTVQSDRWCPNGLAPPAWDAMFGNYGKPVDHWLNMRWDPPAHMALDVGVTYPGSHRDEGIWTININIITPETATTSHYFWSMGRTYAPDDADVSRAWEQAVEIAFNGQDKPMLEAVQRMMGDRDFEELDPILIKPDAAAVRCRRIIQTLLREERTGALAAVG